jgi:transcriptional regulator with XRE-family HTH domain
MEKLIEILSAKIHSKQISITELALKSGCSRQHIYNILQRKQCPSIEMAEKLAESAGISMSIVFKKTRKTSKQVVNNC